GGVGRARRAQRRSRRRKARSSRHHSRAVTDGGELERPHGPHDARYDLGVVGVEVKVGLGETGANREAVREVVYHPSSFSSTSSWSIHIPGTGIPQRARAKSILMSASISSDSNTTASGSR